MGLYSAVVENQAIASSTAETILQLVGPSTSRLRIVEFGISFDGTTAANAPVDVQLLRQTTAGTASTTAQVPVKMDPADPAPAATFNYTYTAEPTAGDVLGSWQLTPNGGLFVMQYPLGREPVMAASGRVGLKVTPGAFTLNATAYLVFEE